MQNDHNSNRSIGMRKLNNLILKKNVLKCEIDDVYLTPLYLQELLDNKREECKKLVGYCGKII